MAWALGNIAALDSDWQTFLLNNGALPPLLGVLSAEKETVGGSTMAWREMGRPEFFRDAVKEGGNKGDTRILSVDIRWCVDKRIGW